MSKRKVCKKCRIFVEGTNCPICKDESFSNLWQGRIKILDPAKSAIAKEMELEHKGEYAIKVR